jgi:MEDS: MEthanogen/methylotroph, DcmR Sensory domain
MNGMGPSADHSASYPHSVKFYSDEHALGRTVAEFLAPGLRERLPAIVIATPEHLALIVTELSRRGLNVAQLEADGDLQALNADDVLARFMVGSQPDPIKFHDTVAAIIDRACKGRRPCPVRAYGEMVDVLWKRANPTGAIQLEMLWNRVATDAQFSLLCGYSVGNFYKEVVTGFTMQTVCDQHNHVIPDERAS